MRNRKRETLRGGTIESLYYPKNELEKIRALQRKADELERKVLSLAAAGNQGYAPYGLRATEWHYANVAASLSATQMNRFATSGNYRNMYAPGGAAVRLWIALNASLTAGTLDVELYIGGASTNMAASLSTGVPDYEDLSVGANTYTYDPGDQIDLRITTSGTFAPTTADLYAILWVIDG